MALLSPITKRSASGFFDSPPRDDAFGVTGRGRKIVRQLQQAIPQPEPTAPVTLSDSEASHLAQEVLEQMKALDAGEQGLLKGTLHDIARATTPRQVLKAFSRADISHIPPRLHSLHHSVCKARGGGRKRNLSKLQAQAAEEQRDEKPIYKPANRTDSRLSGGAVGAQPVPGRILPAGRLSPTFSSNSPSPTSLPSCSSPLFTQPTDQRPHKNLSHSTREVGDLEALLSTLIKESPNQGQGRPSNLPSVTPTPETSFTGRGCIPKLDRSLSPTHSSPLAPINSPPQVPSTFTSSISTNPGEVSDAVYRSILDLLSASKGGKQ